MLDPVVIDFEDEPGWGYIPASAFEKKGKNLKITVSDQDFVQYHKDISNMNGKTDKYGQYISIYETLRYRLASPDKKAAYDKASGEAVGVGNFAYSTADDMKKAKANLAMAINNLDGEPVHVSGTSERYTLTDDQKAKILKMADNYYQTNDARFDPNNTNFIIYTNRSGARKHGYITDFVTFTN